MESLLDMEVEANNFVVPDIDGVKIMRIEYFLDGTVKYIFDDGDEWTNDTIGNPEDTDFLTKNDLWKFETTMFQPFLKENHLRDVRSIYETEKGLWNTIMVADIGQFSVEDHDFDYEIAVEIEEMNYVRRCMHMATVVTDNIYKMLKIYK